MIHGLCLALVSQIVGGPSLDLRAATKGLEAEIPGRIAAFSDHFARMAPLPKPGLDPARLEAPCPSPFEDRMFVAPSMQVAASRYRQYAPLWLDGLSFWAEAPSTSLQPPTWPIVPRGPGATLQVQAKRFESPDKQRGDMARGARPGSGTLGTVGPTALGFGMFVAKEITGPTIATTGHGALGVRLKPVFWRNTIGLRAEF